MINSNNPDLEPPLPTQNNALPFVKMSSL